MRYDAGVVLGGASRFCGGMGVQPSGGRGGTADGLYLGKVVNAFIQRLQQKGII